MMDLKEYIIQEASKLNLGEKLGIEPRPESLKQVINFIQSLNLPPLEMAIITYHLIKHIRTKYPPEIRFRNGTPIVYFWCPRCEAYYVFEGNRVYKSKYPPL